MSSRPPDETIGTAAATELYDLLHIAVDAVRDATWHPGDSLESLLAPAVVAIAVESRKAIQPHAKQVRAKTIRGFEGFDITGDTDSIQLWCRRCPNTVGTVALFEDDPIGMAEILAAMTTHNNEHNEESQT